MSMVRSWLRILCIIVAVLNPGACNAKGHDPDKVRLTAADAPDPFSPPAQQSKLTAVAYVRKVAGLGDFENDDDDDCDGDRGGGRHHSKSFQVTVDWVLKRGTVSVRSISKTVEIKPPFTLVKLDVGGGDHRKRTFVRIEMQLEWDGRNSTGALAAPGDYSYVASADFIRVHEHGNRTIERLIDESEPVPGIVTIAAAQAPPVLVMTSPNDGFLTRGSNILVSGAVSGTSPISLTVNGLPVSIAIGEFSTTASLNEGSNAIQVIATNAAGRTQLTRNGVRDSISPSISIAAPAPGTTTGESTPTFAVTYADSGSGLDLSSLAIRLDSVDITSRFTVAADRATYEPSVPLTPGQHLLEASVADRAGGVSVAEASFTVAPRPSAPSVDPVPATTNLPILLLSGRKESGTALLIDGTVRVAADASATWSTTKSLFEGPNAMVLTVRDQLGGESDPVRVDVSLDSVPPPAPEVAPVPTNVATAQMTVSGRKVPGTAILINSVVVVPINDETTWSVQVPLSQGQNDLIVEARDAAGNLSITAGGSLAAVSYDKPVIGALTVSPPEVHAGSSVDIGYRLFAPAPSGVASELRTTVTVEDGDRLVRTVFTGLQAAEPSGKEHTVTWNGRDDQGEPVPVNTSYRVVVSAEHSGTTSLPASLVDANPKESAVTVIGSQQVSSSDRKLRVVFRPDDARLTIVPLKVLPIRQARSLARRHIHRSVGPYEISVDRPFTSAAVAVYSERAPSGNFLRPYKWDPVQQDWEPVSRTTWNHATSSLSFALSGAGTYLIGSSPDSEPPRVVSTARAGAWTVKVTDPGSGINTAKTRVRCRGVDRTRDATTQNTNGTHAQTLTVPIDGDPMLYLEDWAGNGHLYRVGGSR